MKPKKELRYLPVADLKAETRGDGDDKAPMITGYAAVFNKDADICGWFSERIRPGAFKKTIKEADVRALFNHDPDNVLGRNTAGTLRLKEDKRGLAVEIDPPDAQWANDLLKSMERGDVDQMSFGFEVVKEEWDFEGEKDKRELVEVKLFDVSVVTFPAYDQTSASVRSEFLGLDDKELNLDAITGVVFRASRGVELSNSDREAIEQHIALVRSFLPSISEPEPDGDHSTADDEPVIDHSLVWLCERAKITEAITNFKL